jgi:hypothetical protein
MMERLLTLRLQARGWHAEAWLNDVPVARVTPASPLACVPVHEYTLSGANRWRLVIAPPAAGAPGAAPAMLVLADGQQAARLDLLLPRIGQPVSEHSARSLATLDFAPPAGERVSTPKVIDAELDLPVRFPRWRFIDAPVVEVDAALKTRALAFVQELALALAAGNAAPLIEAARLRFEEIAAAYQRPVADDVTRFRSAIERLYAAKALAIAPPQADAFVLRRCAFGRLLECLDAKGQAVLASNAASDGMARRWPLRLAVVEGRFHVLR